MTRTKIECTRIIFLFVFGVIFATNTALAGFGITPPYVKNDGLTKSSHYEQKIVLVRGDPVEDLRAKITVNVPGADEWISVDRGLEFMLPKGEQQTPIVVSVDVPKKVKFGEYKGNIRVVISPLGGPQAGTVGVVLGAQIDVVLNIIDKQVATFRVWTVNISDLEEGRKVAWMDFPGKIRFTMQIENSGNVAIAPSRVEFEIRDSQGNVIEKTQNTGSIKKLQPFEVKQVIAELPTWVKAGNYTVGYKIYNKEEVVHSGDLSLSILPRGSLPGYLGYGVLGLSVGDLGVLILIIGAALLTLGVGIRWVILHVRIRQ
ncbi:MAG: hypothetical protein AAB495_03395 [Patescibacteria group bacterium]